MEKQKMKLRSHGFTLVELLLVVVIIAIIAGVSGGFYARTYKKLLVEKTARDFLLAAKYARITAIERQSRCRLGLDAVNNRYWLTIEVPNEEGGPAEQVIVRDFYSKPTELGGEVKFENIRINPISLQEQDEDEEQSMIVFSPDGTAQTAVIQIGDGTNHYTISICTATGKAKVYFGTAEKAKADTFDLDEGDVQT